MVKYCPNCGTQNGDDAKFCIKCGNKFEIYAAQFPVSEPAIKELTCPSCGAPLKPDLNVSIITCEYCGNPMIIDEGSWKNATKHWFLDVNVQTKELALNIGYQSLMGRYRNSTIAKNSVLRDVIFKMVPFWLFQVRYYTIFTSNIPSHADRMPPPSEGTFYYPVIGVKSLTQYQPREYFFDLSRMRPFTNNDLSKDIINGDLPQEDARMIAEANVHFILTSQKMPHIIHSNMEIINRHINFRFSKGEILHAPIWYLNIEVNGIQNIMLVDGSNSRVIEAVRY